MQLDEYFELDAWDRICVRGTQLPIEHVLELYLQGARLGEILQSYHPSIRLEQLLATLTYYWQNKPELNVYLERQQGVGVLTEADAERKPLGIVERLRAWQAQRNGAPTALTTPPDARAGQGRTLEDYLDFDSDCDRIRVKGHRIAIEIVIEAFQEGRSAEELVRSHYPTLTVEEVYAVLTYYYQNQAAVDEYMRRNREAAEAAYQEYLRQEPPEVVKRLRALRAQQEATDVREP
jgi:uncharacterized protein (DUF433 family)